MSTKSKNVGVYTLSLVTMTKIVDSNKNIKPSSKMVQLMDEFLDSYADVTLRAERLVLQADEEGIPRKLIGGMLRAAMRRRGITRGQTDYRMKVIGLYTSTSASKDAGLPVESSIPVPTFGEVTEIPIPPDPESETFDCYVEMAWDDLRKQMNEVFQKEGGKGMVTFRVVVDPKRRTAELEICPSAS